MNRKLLPSDLWARALHRSQLGGVPSAWGRSMEKLADGRHAVGMQLGMISVADAVTETGSEPSFTMTGPDPRWTFALPEPISPTEAGLLMLSIDCVETDIDPVVQVFWRSSTGHLSEEASLVFQASFEKNLIPLDSSPHWSILSDISEIRVDVANPAECSTVRMGDFALYDRRSFVDE